jgi:phage terminase large subunit GpA-like protein
VNGTALLTPHAAWCPPADVLRSARSMLRPPPRQRLSTWIETHLILPEGVSALPGPARLWPYQREIADAIGDATIERVTLVKPVRVGFTTLLTGAVASFVANDPAPIIVLQPTEDDARDYIVSDLEPIFGASPTVQGQLEDDTAVGERNTLASRRFPGGSLKVLAAKAPRNLRRHTTRVLLIDEADAMQPGAEGSPLLLAERRTLSFPDRKIVLGSTPLLEDTSNVLRSYAQSDQRIYEVPCPSCEAYLELLWAHIEWEADAPETAAFRCPTCRTLVPEAQKPHMVAAGRWRATCPEVRGHAGFRLNALVSLLANATWGKLAVEFLRARNDSDELQTFVNTILAQGWREEGDEVDDQALAARAEPFSLDAVPEDVLLLTAGVDVQGDRLEVTICGWSRTDCWVLGHEVLWGPPADRAGAVWHDLDELLGLTWPHPHGGRLRLEAVVVDSGDSTDEVYAFCTPRFRRKVWAGKGVAGSRPAIAASSTRVGRAKGRLMLIGVDTLKARLFDRIARNERLRFSASLSAAWFEQLASERRVVRYRRGQPVRSFERIKGRAAEALDCTIYALAARDGLGNAIDWEARARVLRVAVDAPAPGPRPGLVRRGPSYRFGAFSE